MNGYLSMMVGVFWDYDHLASYMSVGVGRQFVIQEINYFDKPSRVSKTFQHLKSS